MVSRPSRRATLALLSLAALAACAPNPGKRDEAPPAPDTHDPLPPKPPPAVDLAPPVALAPDEPWPDAALPPGADERRAPLSLTASDGAGLRLVSLTSRGVIDAPLAFTELRLVFENPEDRTIEGRFEIDMPPGAAISRFAMKIGGAWQEGEVVERQAARVAYEDFLHRRQDPALLENNAGNSFSARVFPIGPRERKELIVAFSQELVDSDEPYRVMLRGLPELDALDASVVVREPAGPAAATSNLGGQSVRARVFQVQKQRYRPDRDLEIAVDRPGALGLRHGRLALARVAPAGDMPPDPVGSLVVLFDTSASRALDLARQIALLHDVLKDLRARSGEDFPLRIVAFDQDTAELFSGRVSTLAAADLERLRARRALGASDLAGALKAVAAAPRGATRLLLVSDGVATAGAHEVTGLRDATRLLAAAGIGRADAIVAGGIQDTTTLKAITTEDLPRDGVVIDGRLPAPAVAAKLGARTLPPLAIEVPGATWTWPTRAEGVQPGDELLVYADLPEDHAMTVVLTGEQRIEVPVAAAPTERPLLERAWIRAQIDRLEAERSALPPDDLKDRADFKAAIVELSTRHRVLSDFTALLVLETEQDYARFGIDRNALADIMSVGPTGVALLARSAASPPVPAQPPPAAADIEAEAEDAEPDADAPALAAPAPAPAPAEADAEAPAEKGDDARHADAKMKSDATADDGLSGLGLVGTGRGGGGTGEGTIGLGNTGLIGSGGGGTGQGYGRGAGAGFGGRGTSVPMVRQARAEVTGQLDPDIIRRIVRAHINEIRYCYNQVLASDPNARGRVTVHFVIDETGHVPSATLKESTLRDDKVGACVVTAVKRWLFPRPQAGLVDVVYPFMFEPSSGPAGDDDAPSAWNGDDDDDDDEDLRAQGVEPYTGKFLAIHQRLRKGDRKGALQDAFAWLADSPGDVLALVAIGEAAEASGDRALAARAYGSIIDLFPARADLRRYAGNRLEPLGDLARELVVDTYRKAAESRPDHPASHRLLAYALVRAGRHRDAFEALERAFDEKYRGDRFEESARLLREDLGLLAAAWIKAEPAVAQDVEMRLALQLAEPARAPSTRFVITWETDANDVDFHVHDGRGGHAWYEQMELRSGGELFADITDGYGPECFAIPGKPKAYPYHAEAHYYSRGPMGYGMGTLQIVQHDGKGGLRFRERPFIIMQDDAYVDLGRLTGPL